jgi:hypothetical protein
MRPPPWTSHPGGVGPTTNLDLTHLIDFHLGLLVVVQIRDVDLGGDRAAETGRCAGRTYAAPEPRYRLCGRCPCSARDGNAPGCELKNPTAGEGQPGTVTPFRCQGGLSFSAGGAVHRSFRR